MAFSGKLINHRQLSTFVLALILLTLFHSPWTSAQTSNQKPAASSSDDGDTGVLVKKNTTSRYRVVTVNFPYVEVPYVICLWILLASVAKIGFHLYDKLPHIFPESCLLIVLGIVVGVTLHYTETASKKQYTLDANVFFLFLLPPIVFDTGFTIPNRPLFNNFGTILMFAVVNTLWNTFGIGVALWGMSYLGWIERPIGVFNGCVFGALISAVDPVAVIAIFEEIQVNEILYIIVFGESLLNDGVTVVMYRMMVGFASIGEENLEAIDYAAGVAQFFVVILGGTLIGVIFGIIGVIITKYTDHVRIMEPLFIFVLGYLGYLTSEIIGLSSILALTFGGIIMKHYTESNMVKKSTTTVKHFLKMMATISETIIFMFLGLSTITDTHDFQLDFILFAILFCIFFRVTGIVTLSYFLNRHRLIRLSPIDQFIMSYGGLRGAVAFCLALLLDPKMVPEKDLFLTTTTVIIYFTVFIQGVTIKPVVNALKVERAGEKEPSMNEIIHKRFIDHLMAGIEDIIGKTGHNSFQHKFDYYNTKYLKPLLLREKPKTRNPKIIRTFNKLTVQDAKAAVIVPQGIPGDSETRNQQNARIFRRRATIAVPGSPDHIAMTDVHSSDPSFTKTMDADMHAILQNYMSKPGTSRIQERRHTLAEFKSQSSVLDTEQGDPGHQNSQRHHLDDITAIKFYLQDDNFGSGVHQTSDGGKVHKVVSFSGETNFKLSDLATTDDATEAQEEHSFSKGN